MNATEERFSPSALIPWVIALVALIGCGALLPNPAPLRKSKDLDGTCLTQVSGEAQAKGPQAQAGIHLAPAGCGRLQLAAPASWHVGLADLDRPFAGRGGRGEVQGRAPPLPEHC